jgi:hypothetical protein
MVPSPLVWHGTIGSENLQGAVLQNIFKKDDVYRNQDPKEVRDYQESVFFGLRSFIGTSKIVCVLHLAFLISDTR